MASGARSRGWCVTMNITADEAKNWSVYQVGLFTSAQWSCRQLERAPTTGQYHIQGCMYFKSPRTFDSLKKKCRTAHWEPMKGSIESNRKYCSKEESRVENTHCIELGDAPKQGTRSDLSAVAIVTGKQTYGET